MDFKLVAGLALLSLLLPGCKKQYEYPYPLRLTADKIELPMYEGESRIVIYSNTSWTARLVEEKPWAELIGNGGKGIGDVMLRFTENRSIPRMAKVALAAGNAKDTVTFIQSGSISTPSFNFKESIISIDGSAGKYTLPFETDVPDINDLVKASVVYYYEGEAFEEIALDDAAAKLPVEKWIYAFNCDEDKVTIDVKANTSEQKRSADFYLLLDNGVGISYKISIRIRQSAL